MSIAPLRRVAVGVLLTALVATPAHAQFGALKNKVKKAVTGESAEEAGALAPAPTFDNATVEMTGERLDALLKISPKLEAMYKQMAVTHVDTRNRADAYEECRDKAMEDWQAAFTKRLQDAQMKMDQKAMQVLADTMMQFSQDSVKRGKIMDRIAAKCGARPDYGAEITTDDLRRELKAQTGLTPEQWAILQERLKAALVNTKKHFDNARASGYSANETKAIGDRFDALRSMMNSDWPRAL